MRFYSLLLGSAIATALTFTGCSSKEATTGPEITPTSAAPAPAEKPAEASSPAPSASYGDSSSQNSSNYSGAGGGYGGGYGGGDSMANYGGAGGGYGAGYSDGGGQSNYGGAGGGYNGGDSSQSGYGGGGGGYGGGSAAPAKPLTFMEAANKAFAEGNEVQAARFAKAAAIAGDEEAAKVIESVRWSTISQQPELVTQIAVGYEIDAPEGLTEYNPIYYGRMASSGGGDSSGYGGGGYGGGYGDSGSNRQTKAKEVQRVEYTKEASKHFHTDIEKAAGLMATEVIKFMSTAHTEGAWMPLFAEQEVKIQSPDKPAENSGSGGYGGGSSYGSSYGSGESGYGSSYGSSSYGSSGQPAPAAEDPLKDKVKAPEHARVAPALHYIGSGKLGDLVKKSKEGGYAALVVFQVTVKPNRRSQYIQNECIAKLINLNTGKPVAVSKTLRNDDVAEEMAKGKETIVEEGMLKIVETAKKGLSLTSEFPAAITPEIIKSSRLPALTSDASKDRLDRIFELHYWQSKGHLTDVDFQAACESILGEEGTTLATGSKEEKTKILVDLL